MAGLLIGLISVGAIGAALVGMPREVLVGSYSTSLTARTASQRHNAQLGLSRLRGAVIEPGALFSFNERVGSFSRDRGFRKAPVSYNGQLIDDWGGGVCQTSSTLYNAALVAGMVIVERNRHRFAPSYVPPGRDAAVAFQNIDLRFRNPLPYAVRVIGEVSGGRMTISLVGERELKEKAQVVSEVSELSDPETYMVSQRQGRLRVRNAGKTGCNVTVIRTTGARREVISHDMYPAMNRVVQKG